MILAFLSVNRNGKLALAIMKQMEATSWKLIIQQNFQLPTPKVWVSTFLSVDGNGKLALAIINKMEKWLPCHGNSLYSIISNYWSHQSLGLHFSECPQKWKMEICHYEKMGKWLPCHGNSSYSKISNYQPLPPKSLGLHFSECQQQWKMGIGHYKKCYSQKLIAQKVSN